MKVPIMAWNETMARLMSFWDGQQGRAKSDQGSARLAFDMDQLYGSWSPMSGIGSRSKVPWRCRRYWRCSSVRNWTCSWSCHGQCGFIVVVWTWRRLTLYSTFSARASLSMLSGCRRCLSAGLHRAERARHAPAYVLRDLGSSPHSPQTFPALISLGCIVALPSSSPRYARRTWPLSDGRREGSEI